MAFNFNEALEAKNNSKLTEGRTKISTESICEMNKDGVTIVGADVVNGKNGETAILIFEEYPDRFTFGGSVITEAVNKWLDGFGGDADAMNAEIAAQGGVRVILERVKSKNGNTYTNMRNI